MTRESPPSRDVSAPMLRRSEGGPSDVPPTKDEVDLDDSPPVVKGRPGDRFKLAHEERLLAFNSLTRHWMELPRKVVSVHVYVDQSSKSCRILVAGFSTPGDESLSRITELYDSQTEKWERVGGLPGPAFPWNEYQSGVFQYGNIFFKGFVTQGDQKVKGILGYNVEEGIWSTKWTAEAWPNRTNLPLVEISGALYLFSEREYGRDTEHWVDRIEWVQSEGEDEEKMDTFTLVNVVRKRKSYRALLVYPEFAVGTFSESQLCIFNTLEHFAVIYAFGDEDKSEALPVSAPSSKRFQPSNPCLSFGFPAGFAAGVFLNLPSVVGATPVSAPWPPEVSSTYSPFFYVGIGAAVFGTALTAAALGVKVYRYYTRRESEDTLRGAIEELTRPFRGCTGGLHVRVQKLQVGEAKLTRCVFKSFPPGTSPPGTDPGSSSPGTSTWASPSESSSRASLPGTSVRAFSV